MVVVIKDIYNLLLNTYKNQGWWPISHSTINPKFEIITGAVLTQNTSWKNVEKALDNLIHFDFLNAESIMKINQDELANVIRPSGYYNQKAKKLKIITRFLVEGNYLKNGNIPDRNDLLDIWGIGAETADSILLYAYNMPVFVVDTYTVRLLKRLGIVNGKESYEETAAIFTDSLKRNAEIYQEYHALIVKHAKEHCRKKPECKGCVLAEICKYASI